jgi:predicted nucleic acid-binding protein
MDDSVKHDIALSVISDMINNNNGVISIQVLAEFSKIIGKTMRADEINSRIADYQNSFPVLSYSIAEIKKANEIFETYNIHFFDALIVATMDSQNIRTIVTENESDFKKIPWLTVINPFKKDK